MSLAKKNRIARGLRISLDALDVYSVLWGSRNGTLTIAKAMEKYALHGGQLTLTEASMKALLEELAWKHLLLPLRDATTRTRKYTRTGSGRADFLKFVQV